MMVLQNEPIAMTAAFTSLSVEAFVGRILESTLRRTLSIAETDSYIDEGKKCMMKT